jgi:hypothetical protein
MMWINFLKPTNTQITWKTIRGMVTKNLIALMLTGHPLGLIENMIHMPIDRVVNKKFCTNNKLLNVWVHLATCLSVDGLIHGTGYEIAETFMSDGWGHVHGSASSDAVWTIEVSSSSWTDAITTDNTIMTDSSIDSISESPTETITSETETTQAPTESTPPSPSDAMRKAMLKAKAQAVQVVEASGIDAYDPTTGQDFTKMYQAADAQWLIDHTWHHHVAWYSHAGHIHGDWHAHEAHTDHGSHAGHDHEHGWHGIVPILWWAIVEEYGPTMYKITKQRTKNLVEDLFNMTPASDTTIVKKSDFAVV